MGRGSRVVLLFSQTTFFQILFTLCSMRSSENVVTRSEMLVEKCMWCLDLGIYFFVVASAQIVLVNKRLHSL